MFCESGTICFAVYTVVYAFSTNMFFSINDVSSQP